MAFALESAGTDRHSPRGLKQHTLKPARCSATPNR